MKQTRSRFRMALMALPLSLSAAVTAQAAPASTTRDLKLEDYKYFRALSIDLQGRVPTRQEIAEFEKPDFSLDTWLDSRLGGEGYVDRLTQIYSDVLHPQINGFRHNTFARTGLSAVTFRDPAGKLTRLYFRPSQVRPRVTSERARLNLDANFKACAAIKDPARDPQYVALSCANYEKYDNLLKANLCMTADELGVRYNGSSNFAPLPYPAMDGDTAGMAPRANASQAELDQYTTLIKPWWLYADYQAPSASQRYDAATWATRFPGYTPGNFLLKEPDNTDVMAVRVCNEEVATALTAVADGRKNADGTPMMVSCQTGAGATLSSGCGCGPGLSWCMPAGTYNTTFPAGILTASRNVLLGTDDPTDQVAFSANDWMGLWLSQEPVQFLNKLFSEDRDFRESVTGRWTVVNGPLAQFYRLAARVPLADLDMSEAPLPNVDAMPNDLLPIETQRWITVADRGKNAAGVLTQPWFTMKNATRRARGHVVYNAFLCRDFVAPPGLQLAATPEPDLTKRSGCAVCHHTLEPLSAYFARTLEGDWSWVDSRLYPTQQSLCKKAANGNIPGSCTTRYDSIFSTTEFGALRGSYGSPANTNAGPAGLGEYLVSQPGFAGCAVQNVAESFLGRELRAEDAALRAELSDGFTQGGYRMKALVKALVQSKAYRSANNWSSTVWRSEGK